MLAAILAFCGSLFNLLIDTIFKIGVAVALCFLAAIVIGCGFAVLIFNLVT